MNEYMKYLAEIFPEKDSLKLVKSEAEKYYKSHSLDECFNMGMELYQSDRFQIQEVGIFLLGYSAHYNTAALSFLKLLSASMIVGKYRKFWPWLLMNIAESLGMMWLYR